MRWIAFFLFFLANASIEVGAPRPDYGEEFGAILEKAGRRLDEQARRRPHRLAHMNESLSRMAEAARGMARGADPESILELLRESRRAYGDNSFALLLEGVLLSGQGKTEEANSAFVEFMTQSRTFTGFEKVFLRFAEFHRLRRTVYELLRSRGISFEGREEDIRARVPYQRLVDYMKDAGGPDSVMGYGFLVVLLGGGLLLLLGGLTGAVDFGRPLMGNIIVVYVFTWVAYGIWLLDLAYGLPLGLERFQVIPVMYGALALVLAGVEIFRLRQERRRPLEEGYMRCPGCREPIPKLMTVCPRCRRRL